MVCAANNEDSDNYFPVNETFFFILAGVKGAYQSDSLPVCDSVQLLAQIKMTSR